MPLRFFATAKHNGAQIYPYMEVEGLIVHDRVVSGAVVHDHVAGKDGEIHADIVVNATASSLAGELPPLPAGVFRPGALALDMVYSQQATVFMAFAASQGAIERDGLGMLVEQAAESFAIWRGVRPQTAQVMQDLRNQP